MAIQVTLSANQFNYSGTYNGRDYTSLQVNRTSKGRIYFSIIRDGIRWCEMAKQIKLEDGIAFVSFGKNDKLIVGTYTDDTIQEEVKEVIEEVTETNESTNEEVVTTLDKAKCLRVIYCEARSQFLVEHYNLSITELNSSYDEHMNMISNKLNTMTDNETIGFIEINCTLESIEGNSVTALYTGYTAAETNNADNNNPNQSNESNQVGTAAPIKLNKQKEKVLLKGYMSKGFEGYDGQQFKYKDLDFYLVKSKNRWCIVEKTTKLYAVTWRKQRKQVFAEFELFMSQRYEKVKEHVDKRNSEVS